MNWLNVKETGWHYVTDIVPATWGKSAYLRFPRRLIDDLNRISFGLYRIRATKSLGYKLCLLFILKGCQFRSFLAILLNDDLQISGTLFLLAEAFRFCCRALRTRWFFWMCNFFTVCITHWIAHNPLNCTFSETQNPSSFVFCTYVCR